MLVSNFSFEEFVTFEGIQVRICSNSFRISIFNNLFRKFLAILPTFKSNLNKISVIIQTFATTFLWESLNNNFFLVFQCLLLVQKSKKMPNFSGCFIRFHEFLILPRLWYPNFSCNDQSCPYLCLNVDKQGENEFRTFFNNR